MPVLVVTAVETSLLAPLLSVTTGILGNVLWTPPMTWGALASYVIPRTDVLDLRWVWTLALVPAMATTIGTLIICEIVSRPRLETGEPSMMFTVFRSLMLWVRPRACILRAALLFML